jgi:hypothetical protein
MEIPFDLPRVPTAGHQGVGHFHGDAYPCELTNLSRLPAASLAQIMHGGE